MPRVAAVLNNPIKAMIFTEDEARRYIWPSKEARPSLKAFQRLRRIHGIPCSKIGRRRVMFEEDLIDYLKQNRDNEH